MAEPLSTLGSTCQNSWPSMPLCPSHPLSRTSGPVCVLEQGNPSLRHLDPPQGSPFLDLPRQLGCHPPNAHPEDHSCSMGNLRDLCVYQTFR